MGLEHTTFGNVIPWLKIEILQQVDTPNCREFCALQDAIYMEPLAAVTAEQKQFPRRALFWPKIAVFDHFLWFTLRY